MQKVLLDLGSARISTTLTVPAQEHFLRQAHRPAATPDEKPGLALSSPGQYGLHRLHPVTADATGDPLPAGVLLDFPCLPPAQRLMLLRRVGQGGIRVPGPVITGANAGLDKAPRERDILLNVGVQPADRAEHPLPEPFGNRPHPPRTPPPPPLHN